MHSDEKMLTFCLLVYLKFRAYYCLCFSALFVTLWSISKQIQIVRTVVWIGELGISNFGSHFKLFKYLFLNYLNMVCQHHISLFKMCLHICAVTLFSSKITGTVEIGKCLLYQQICHFWHKIFFIRDYFYLWTTAESLCVLMKGDAFCIWELRFLAY